MQKENYLTDK